VVHEEYISDDDFDDDASGEVMAMASVAISTSSPTLVSLFDALNENLIPKCLMAKGINKVTSNIKTSTSTNPSLALCGSLEQLDEANDIIESHEDTITNLEGHSHDYDDEIVDLSIAPEEERGIYLALEESHNVDLAKLKKDHDHTLILAPVLKSEKVELGVGHARLQEEFEVLDKAHKALKSAHATLKEYHDQLQVKLTKEISTCPPFVLIYNAHLISYIY
jgi:hypothetical protein